MLLKKKKIGLARLESFKVVHSPRLRSFWKSSRTGIQGLRCSWQHPCPRPLHRIQRAYYPAMMFWRWWWRIVNRWCQDQRSPSTWFLGRCASKWSSHQQIWRRIWICHQCRCDLWNLLLGTWNSEWPCGRWSPCTRNPSPRCTMYGSSRSFLELHQCGAK